MLLGSNLVAMKQIGFAENTYDAPFVIDDGKSAYVVIHHQLHSFRHVLLRPNRHYIVDHYVAAIISNPFLQ
jgi:hypothetical protein